MYIPKTMSKFNPFIHDRRSIRLKGYDYSKEGLYFITICCHKQQYLFECIPNVDDVSCSRRPTCRPNELKIELNDAGKMIENWYFKLENKFSNIKCHEMVVMPNHFHCIIEITNESVDATALNDASALRADTRVRPDIPTVVQWFKTMTTNEYIRGVKTLGWQRFDGKLWQRDYYEHIIRNHQSFIKISNYIRNNPTKWHIDKFNKK
ncbi:MAG: transposase [Chitinophagales bacterium]|nr:transposase [Chitinophagales bacterium]